MNQTKVPTQVPDPQKDLCELIDFVKATAAELRPPAQHIENFAALILKSDGMQLEAKTVHHLKTISESSQKLSLLLDDLDRFVRVRYERLLPLDLDLREVVDEAIN